MSATEPQHEVRTGMITCLGERSGEYVRQVAAHVMLADHCACGRTVKEVRAWHLACRQLSCA